VIIQLRIFLRRPQFLLHQLLLLLARYTEFDIEVRFTSQRSLPMNFDETEKHQITGVKHLCLIVSSMLCVCVCAFIISVEECSIVVICASWLS
jgi:hypothetical protein